LTNYPDKQNSRLNECLKIRAAKARLDWPDLSRHAVEIIAFGSRAVGTNRQASELDILLVGSGARRIKRCGLDLICIPVGDLVSPSWLYSELAGHIARYGVWLKGAGRWREKAFVGPEASKQKERRLVSLACSVSKSWTRLHPAFQLKYRVTIRRELQRLILLQSTVPIPPTPSLDMDWRSGNSGRDALIDVSKSVFSETSEFVLRHVLV
jgi:hypothetical protein